MTLLLETLIGLGTGKFEVKFKTGTVAVATCCPAELSAMTLTVVKTVVFELVL